MYSFVIVYRFTEIDTTQLNIFLMQHLELTALCYNKITFHMKVCDSVWDLSTEYGYHHDKPLLIASEILMHKV